MAGKKRTKAAAVPLAPPPITVSGSRKRARQVTTLFHKYTRQRDEAVAKAVPDEPERLEALIEQIGGRRAYQRASQISTSFHSTSKWVLGCLAQNGWLYGIRSESDDDPGTGLDTDADCDHSNTKRNRKRQRSGRRPTRLLEVGAINTELLDAAATLDTTGSGKKYRLDVRAIDLHSMHDGIEEADFLELKVPEEDVSKRYDVIVCSMVLNCVTTAAARGEMMARFYHFLRPGGLVYVTIPKTCLNLSPYMDKGRFEQMLRAVGLTVEPRSKDSPKVAFFVCSRPSTNDNVTIPELDPKWTKLATIRRGKKYRNEFAVTLNADDVSGRTLTYETK